MNTIIGRAQKKPRTQSQSLEKSTLGQISVNKGKGIQLRKESRGLYWLILNKPELLISSFELFYLCLAKVTEVIVNGDAPAIASASAGTEGPIPPKTFHGIKEEKTLWEAIKARFGGNKESKRMQKIVLKRQYKNFAALRSKGLDKIYDSCGEDDDGDGDVMMMMMTVVTKMVTRVEWQRGGGGCGVNQMGFESLEARIVVHEKNEVIYEEDIAFLNQICAKDKAGLGYDSQINESEVVHSVFNSRESDVDSPVNDRFKTGERIVQCNYGCGEAQQASSSVPDAVGYGKCLLKFCGMKGIKKEFIVARTPQKNRVAERNNRKLIEAARTMLADSLLPTTFWAEAVSIACYVHNRVLVTKPHNKTPYELLHGRPPSISCMRPFRCHVTILNTLDPLGKFDEKADEGFFIGYSINNKAFRVFNTRTRKVKENLHINFLENKPNVVGSGPKWIFIIDLLTNSMNYEPVTVGNQTNKNASIKDDDDALLHGNQTNRMQDQGSNEEPAIKGDKKWSREMMEGASNKEDDQNVQDFRVTLDNLLVQQKKGYANSTNIDSTVSPSVSTVGQNFTNADDLPTDPPFA
ncbi:retrovirus-related pol polyprotein from transposon TNT 1-94 [Tanacetum coccineum]